MDVRGPASTYVERGLPAGGGEVVMDGAALNASGVSWGAVIAGAFVAAALALILLALGAGFGLALTSPWSNEGASASAIGTGEIIWLIVIEAIASAMGGYLTGRLRTKWPSIHTDEVHFRDTANGFLAWAVAVVISVAFLGTAAVSLAGTAPVQAAAMSGETGPDGMAGTGPYYVDRLFRSPRSGTVPADESVMGEAARVFAEAVRHPQPPAGDLNYLAQLVSARTGLTQGEAERRVSETLLSARVAADQERKALTHFLLWSFIALLIGAFCASAAATVGGRQRDHVRAIS